MGFFMVLNGPLMGFNGAQWFSLVFDWIYTVMGLKELNSWDIKGMIYLFTLIIGKCVATRVIPFISNSQKDIYHGI